jgi:hypothetical protein
MPTPSTPIITNLPSSGTYGGSFTPTVTTTGDGQTSVSSATTNVCTVSSGTVNYVGIGTCTMVAHVGAGANYASADGGNQSFSINRAAASTPSITNLPSSGTYGGLFTPTVATDGDGPISLTSSTPRVCAVDPTSSLVAYVAVGTCTLVAHVGTGASYVGADGGNQSFAINRAAASAPSITNLPSSGTFGGSFTPAVTTNGDGQTSVSSATTNVCTVSSGTVNYVGVGTCTLVAHVGTGANYVGADGGNQSFTVISSHSPTSVSVQSVVDGTVLVSWSPPSNNGVTPISSYTATASPGDQTCTTSGTTCTISDLGASTAYTVQVVATNVSGSSLPSTRSIAIYALAASSMKVKVIQFVVPTKSLFTVLAYGAPAKKVVTIAVPGSHKSCTTNAAGQCTVSLSVKNPGSYNALAILGTTTTSSPFYAPSISVPLSAQHGKSFTVAISHAPSIAPVVVTLGDGRVKIAVTNGAGAVSIPVPALIAGLLKVTVSVAGVGFTGSTVLVS